MTYYFALILLGRAFMGIGKSPAEAISDAKYYCERECSELPDDPADPVYYGHWDGEWRIDKIPESVYRRIESGGLQGEEVYDLWLDLEGWIRIESMEAE